MIKYKDKLKLVSIRQMTGKLFQIDQSRRNEQMMGEFIFDKNVAHMQRNMPNLHKWTHIPKPQSAKKNKLMLVYMFNKEIK